MPQWLLLAGRLTKALVVACVLRLRSFWARRNQLEKSVLGLASFCAALILLTYSWEGWWFGWHANWPATYAAGAILAFLIVFFRLSDRTAEERHSLEGAAAFFASMTLLAAGYWYFYERPGVPKLDVETAVEAWPIGEGLAVVRIEVKLQNVGSTIISFDNYTMTGQGGGRDDRLKVDLGKVFPFDADYAANVELLKKFKASLADESPTYPLEQTYKWPPLARAYELPAGEIEAGETEQYYYKAVIPCTKGMILASTVRVPKLGSGLQKGQPGGGQSLVWLAQALSKPVSDCDPSLLGRMGDD